MIRQISFRFLTFALVSLGLLTEGKAQVVLVQQAIGGSTGASFSATLPSAPTPSNLLVAIAATRNEGVLTPPAGWSTAVNHSGGSSVRPNQAIFYKIAGVSESATVMVTTTATGNGNALQIFEYSGIDTTLPFDAANTGESQGTGTTVSSGNVSTTNANDLIIAGLVSRAGTSLTSWTNSFTLRNSFNEGSGSNVTLFGGADNVVTTNGAYSTTATADASEQWRGVIAAFRIATVAPPLPPTISGLNPTSGPTAGGTSVTIDGTNLSGATSVTFGGAAAAITANTATQITVTAPAGPAGAVDVAVQARVPDEGWRAFANGRFEPKHSLTELRQAGIGFDSPQPAGAAGTVVELPNAERPSEFRVTLRNFYVITRYNRSALYAAAVADLALELKKNYDLGR